MLPSKAIQLYLLCCKPNSIKLTIFYLISGTDSELDSGIQEKEDFTDEESKASKVTARRHISLIYVVDSLHVYVFAISEHH